MNTREWCRNTIGIETHVIVALLVGSSRLRGNMTGIGIHSTRLESEAPAPDLSDQLEGSWIPAVDIAVSGSVNGNSMGEWPGVSNRLCVVSSEVFAGRVLVSTAICHRAVVFLESKVFRLESSLRFVATYSPAFPTSMADQNGNLCSSSCGSLALTPSPRTQPRHPAATNLGAKFRTAP